VVFAVFHHIFGIKNVEIFTKATLKPENRASSPNISRPSDTSNPAIIINALKMLKYGFCGASPPFCY